MKVLKRFIFASALMTVLVAPLLAPSSAQAWWAHPGWGWGWHGGWGWRGGVFIGGPVVVARPPVVYAPSAYRWIPGHYTPYGAWVPPHWGYY
jgi:hypothetical protein